MNHRLTHIVFLLRSSMALEDVRTQKFAPWGNHYGA